MALAPGLPTSSAARRPDAALRPALSALLVLSDPAARELCAAVLRDRGHSVREAGDGEAAFAACEDSPPDLLFLEARFTQRDGFELCRRLRRLAQPRPPVILMVMSPGNPALLQEALAAGADGYFSTPLEAAALHTRLDVLEWQRTRPPALSSTGDSAPRGSSRARESAERTAGRLLDALPEAVLAIGDGGQILWSNPAAEQRFGASRDRLSGRSVATLFPGADGAALPEFLQNAGGGSPRTLRALKARRDDGTSFLAQATFVPLTGLSADMGWLVTVRDTASEAFEDLQQRESVKMGAVATVASGIANDFNNALAAVSSSIEAARLQLPSSRNPVRTELDAAMHATRNAARLVRRLLHFSRPSPSRRVPLNPKLLVDEAAGVLRLDLDPRIVLVTRFDHGDWYAHADLEQIVDLLVSMGYNARESMPQGGTLTIRTARTPAASAQPVPGPAKDYVRIEMSDTGCGIPQEHISRIFEPLFTTKQAGRGSGMGLSTAWNVLQQHEGGVTVESAPGAGSTFRVYLPRTLEVELAQERTVPAPGSGTILLVDDEPSVRRPLRRALEHYGYTVLEARDGVEALEVYGTASDRIRLVVLDEKMPRMCGHEVLAELRVRDPDLPVLLTSGYSPEDADLPDSMSLADGYLVKPYELSQLTSMVRQLLDRGPRRPAA